MSNNEFTANVAIISDGADRTEVSFSQENNADENSRLEPEKNWNVILEWLKTYAEESDIEGLDPTQNQPSHKK